jgi:hypothetical protein
VAEANGGAGALALERRRRRRATSGAVAEEERGGGGGATGEAGGGAERWRFGEGKEWNGGTHRLGCKIGKLLEQFVFWG